MLTCLQSVQTNGFISESLCSLKRDVFFFLWSQFFLHCIESILCFLKDILERILCYPECYSDWIKLHFLRRE